MYTQNACRKDWTGNLFAVLNTFPTSSKCYAITKGPQHDPRVLAQLPQRHRDNCSRLARPRKHLEQVTQVAFLFHNNTGHILILFMHLCNRGNALNLQSSAHDQIIILYSTFLTPGCTVLSFPGWKFLAVMFLGVRLYRIPVNNLADSPWMSFAAIKAPMPPGEPFLVQ